MNYYKEEHRLPSNGVLEDVPYSIVTIRNMTTSEEKFLLGSSGEGIFDAMLKECVVEPKDFQIKDLISPDKHFLIIKLRVLSFGPLYPVNYTHKGHDGCGGSFEYLIDLSNLETKHLPEDFEEPYDEFELPVSKSKVSLRIPRIKDLEGIERKARKFKKKFPNSKGDISYIYRIASNLCNIDGEDLTESQKDEFVEKLHSMDASYIKTRISKLEVGMDTTIYELCKGCGEELEFELPFNAEFFRSRFED